MRFLLNLLIIADLVWYSFERLQVETGYDFDAT